MHWLPVACLCNCEFISMYTIHKIILEIVALKQLSQVRAEGYLLSENC